MEDAEKERKSALPKAEFSESTLRFFTRTVLIILAVGLAVRLILAPILTYPFDIEHWAVIMQNTESGNGLFGLTGYFYTPVWGYMLGFEDLVYNSVASLDVYGERFTNLFGIENMADRFYTATTTTPTFNVAMKIPLILCDVLVGYLVFRMVYERTGDEKRATTGFALWFLCPIVIYMSGVQAMFDCYSALFSLLCILLLQRDHCLLAGAMFAVAALIKFFPAFCIIVFVLYIYRKNGGMIGAIRTAEAAAGAAIAVFVIFLPTILDGTAGDAFSFVFARTSGMDFLTLLKTAFAFVVLILSMAGTAYVMLRSKAENLDDDLVKCSLIVLCASTFFNMGPQYCIVYLPLLAYFIAIGKDRAYLWCFVVIVAMSTISAFFNNSLSLLTSANEFLGLGSTQGIIDAMIYLESHIVLGYGIPMAFVNYGEIVKLVFMILLMLFFWADICKRDSLKIPRGWIFSVKRFMGGGADA